MLQDFSRMPLYTLLAGLKIMLLVSVRPTHSGEPRETSAVTGDSPWKSPPGKARLLRFFGKTMFGTSQGLKGETVFSHWKSLRSHILKLCLALPIVSQQ